MAAAAIGTAALAASPPAAIADPLEVKVGVVRMEHPRDTISILDIPAADDFVAGAKLAMADNNTTGRFLDQSFPRRGLKLAPDDARRRSQKRDRFRRPHFSSSTSALTTLLKVADAARDKDALVFNDGAPDERLREEDCRANVIHTAPSPRDAGRRARAST